MWNEVCSQIFTEYVTRLDDYNIRYFVLRNQEGLPQNNTAKDVDIIIEPYQIKNAKKIFIDTLKLNKVEYFDCFVTGKMICMHGISLTRKIGIHIDIIAGLNIKGYEMVEFDKMYKYAIKVNGVWVLEKKYEVFLTYISKQFGQKKVYFKDKYVKEIEALIKNEKDFFISKLSCLVSKKYLNKTIEKIERKEYGVILEDGKNLTKQIKARRFIKKPINTLYDNICFYVEKIFRIIFAYKKYARSFALIAPDGTGKSSLMEKIIDEINYYYVSENKVSLYHFRPEIFPNLREVGRKMKIVEKKEITSDPHALKPVGKISSFIRMAYYILDYMLGWAKKIRNDVHYDKYSAFDRYSYDLLVDPERTRIKLPYLLRKIMVKLTPKPKVVLALMADSKTIYSRKQELEKDEIERQLKEYQKIIKEEENVYEINAEETLENMAKDAIKIIFDKCIIYL